jgi:hypothetical protein
MRIRFCDSVLERAGFRQVVDDYPFGYAARKQGIFLLEQIIYSFLVHEDDLAIIAPSREAVKFTVGLHRYRLSANHDFSAVFDGEPPFLGFDGEN